MLEEYRAKRKFDATPEPRGAEHVSGKFPVFVIHEHHATALHWDLRLEIDGVLKSWAVPKGVSTNPKELRLAVETEDHPMEYGNFEGSIPVGNYGAGRVIIWDRGYWRADEDAVQAYGSGHLKFTLYGEVLRGRWVLIRTKDRDGKKQWLLKKEMHDTSRNPVVMQGIMCDLPEDMQLMPLTQLVSPPAGDDYIHEIKEDGVRIKVMIDKDGLSALTRNNNEWIHRIPSIAAEFNHVLAVTAWLDCELVVMRSEGVSSFEYIQRLDDNEEDAILMVHDIMYLDGYDIRQLPLLTRKQLLTDIISTRTSRIRANSYIIGRGDKFFKRCCQFGDEGTVSKLISSAYDATASKLWFKTPCELHRQEFVIGGYTISDKREFSALLVGAYNDVGKLAYVSKVGIGFNFITLYELMLALDKLKTTKCPFASDPGIKEAVWVKPELVAIIAFKEKTEGGSLRKPRYKGLREDKPSIDVKMDIPLPNVESPATINLLSSPTKEMWPGTGITKLWLTQYFQGLYDQWFLHYEGRPMMIKRCPDGIGGQEFFQKNLGGWQAQYVFGGDGYMFIDSEYGSVMNGIAELIQMNAVEFHTWNCRVEDMGHPDRIIIDIDPSEEAHWDTVATAAMHVKEYLDLLGLESYCKTSGKRGLHVVIPIVPEYTWTEVYNYSKELADGMTYEFPSVFTRELNISARKGKIYLDVARNIKGSTIIEVFSPRALPRAPISCPIDWKQVHTKRVFTIKDMELILDRPNPWANYFTAENRIS